MSGDAPPEAPDRTTAAATLLGALWRLGITVGTLVGGLVSVVVAVAFTAVRTDWWVRPSGGDLVVAVTLVLLASWGVARVLRTALRVRAGAPLRSIGAWVGGAAIVLLGVGWAASRFPAVAVVELALLTCFALGLLVIASDRLHLDSRFAAGAAALIFLIVVAAAAILASTREEPTATYSAAGPEQLAAAAKSGETVRLRGRTASRYVDLAPAVGYASARCTSAPIVEVQRSLLGFETARIEVGITACWDGDAVETLVVQQYAASPWGTAVIEPVLLRSGSVFSADPLSGSLTESKRDVPRYRDTPIDADDVVTDPYSVVPNMKGYERPRAPLMNDHGRVNDDGDASNDTVLARVSPDRSSVSVVAAFSVRYPSLRQFDGDNDPSPLGLEGSPPPRQLWLERFQPLGRELVVAVGNLSKDGGVVRLVHFTHDGQQPWAMTEVS